MKLVMVRYFFNEKKGIFYILARKPQAFKPGDEWHPKRSGGQSSLWHETPAFRPGSFHYTADGRIDFRQLVKDLAKEFKMRIEMRQVGVRDEAKMVGGLGVCGRSLCCFSFMKSFEPVTIQKAKKQQIVINPTKISGLCGRLMCCLAFEDESLGRMYAEEEKVEED